jgi:hypothetical protein
MSSMTDRFGDFVTRQVPPAWRLIGPSARLLLDPCPIEGRLASHGGGTQSGLVGSVVLAAANVEPAGRRFAHRQRAAPKVSDVPKPESGIKDQTGGCGMDEQASLAVGDASFRSPNQATTIDNGPRSLDQTSCRRNRPDE